LFWDVLKLIRLLVLVEHSICSTDTRVVKKLHSHSPNSESLMMRLSLKWVVSARRSAVHCHVTYAATSVTAELPVILEMVHVKVACCHHIYLHVTFKTLPLFVIDATGRPNACHRELSRLVLL